MDCLPHKRRLFTSCQNFVLWLNSFLFIRSLVAFVEGEGLAYEWDHPC
jgi:hypothetical protein